MGKIIFKNSEHLKFYEKFLQKCRSRDVCHKALVYCLGIDEDTRNHIYTIYDFKGGFVRPECLSKGWITSGNGKIIRMAFNLYFDGVPGIYNDELEDQLNECINYTVNELFCCEYAKYFWEAIKIRYPEYCCNKMED